MSLGSGSNLGSVVAVGLLAATVVLAAGTLPLLAPHSPVDGVSEARDRLASDSAGSDDSGARSGTAAGSGSGGAGGASAGAVGSGVGSAGAEAGLPPGAAPLVNDLAELVLGSGLGGVLGDQLAGAGGAGGTARQASGGSASGASGSEESGESLGDAGATDGGADGARGDATGGSDGATGGSPLAGFGELLGGGVTVAEGSDAESAGDTRTAGDGPSDGPAGGALLAALLGALAVYVHRSDRDPIGTLRALFVGLLFGASNAVEALVDLVRSADSLLSLPGRLLATLAAALRSASDRARSLVASGGSDATAPTATEATAARSERERIRRAWRTVVDAAGVSRRARHTPGEIRRRAESSGLPEGDLDVLLSAFRDVEYGARDPESRLDPVASAERRVREAAPESADAGGGDS